MHDPLDRHRARVEQFPDHELARFSLGKALFDARQFAAARTELELALARKPDWMVVQILLGKCALALGNPAAARTAFRQAHALAVAQHHEEPRAELDQLLAELGEAPE